MDAKEEVRSRIAIEDIIGEYVHLKRAGRNYKGLSPFSSEKTPSFFVSPEKNIWHDFSSNKGGDVFAFVMEVEGMDFRQALEHLARKAGVDLSLYDSSTSRQLSERKKRLTEANRLAAQYYQHSLLRNSHALTYVTDARQLSRQTVQDFQIGYAPDSGTALTSYLTKKGFTKKELSDAGLTNRYGGDLFRGRMMVPLMDSTGQVVGFTGRIIIPDDTAPKYLNTPQTLLYDKSRHVFGLSQAKEAIRTKGHVVVVEGNLDVVSSHQAGVRQVVATAGTAMTEHHLRALKRLTPDVRVAYDSDKAGIAATERAIALAANLEIDLTVISLPGGDKDPDELVRRDAGAWRRVIEEQQPAVEWVIDQYKARVDIGTAAGKRSFTTAALAVVRTLTDAVERQHYEQLIAEATHSSVEAVHEKLQTVSETPSARRAIKAEIKELVYDVHAYEDDLLAVACIDAPSQELFAHFDIRLLHTDERQQVANFFARHYGKSLTDTPKELQNIDTYVKILLLRADARYAEWDTNDRYFETARLIRQIEQEHKKQTHEQLTAQLRSAEDTGDEVMANKLRVALNDLIKEIARGKR